MKKLFITVALILCALTSALLAVSCGNDLTDPKVCTPGLIFSYDNGVYYVSGYDSTAKNVVIPEYYDDDENGRAKVEYIGESAFAYANILSVKLPDSIKSIEKTAFYGCTKLEGIELPKKLESIGDAAFCGCEGIKSITLPSSLTKIGDSAFAMSGLGSLNIPKKVSVIKQAFVSNCASLTEITVDAGNESFSAQNGDLYSKDGTKLIAYAPGKNEETPSFPEKVTSYAPYAFSMAPNMVSFTIPSSVTEISAFAFEGCEKLDPNALLNLNFKSRANIIFGLK